MRRSERTPLQQKVASMVDEAIDDLLMDLDNLVRDEVTNNDILVAVRMEHVDLEDAWTDYCDENV